MVCGVTLPLGRLWTRGATDFAMSMLDLFFITDSVRRVFSRDPLRLSAFPDYTYTLSHSFARVLSVYEQITSLFI